LGSPPQTLQVLSIHVSQLAELHVDWHCPFTQPRQLVLGQQELLQQVPVQQELLQQVWPLEQAQTHADPFQT
jgi:hypothetical protein